MKLNNSEVCYTKSLLFVQSSGTGKSRLADAFAMNCPIVNYVIRQAISGFPPRDSEILKFMQLYPTSNISESMDQSLYFKSLPERDQQERTLNTWFHALAIGILQTTFEICKIFPHFPSLLLLGPAYRTSAIV
jgi:hypothetical protein